MPEPAKRAVFESIPNSLCQFVLEPLVGGQQRYWTGTSSSGGMYAPCAMTDESCTAVRLRPVSTW